ncbi:MAG: hypothetical protein M3Q31_05550 [Actinomycetota bacterium]|nr:hypothetical protein [Actinomycetota bacterium]
MRPINREPNVVISAVIPYEMRQQLVALARRDDETLSEEVRRALTLLYASRSEHVEHDLVSTT